MLVHKFVDLNGFSSDSRLIFLVGFRLVQRNHPRTLGRIELEHVPRFISKDDNFKGDRYTTVTIGKAGNNIQRSYASLGFFWVGLNYCFIPKVPFYWRHPKMNQPCFQVISGSWNWRKYHELPQIHWHNDGLGWDNGWKDPHPPSHRHPFRPRPLRAGTAPPEASWVAYCHETGNVYWWDVLAWLRWLTFCPEETAKKN